MPITDSPYQEALRQALVSAVDTKLVRDRRRARTRRVVDAMAVMVAAVVTATLPDNRADASIEVEVRDGTTYVRLLDVESRPDEIVGVLRNAGIEVEVDLVPVGPSNVGRFIRMTSSGSGVDNVGGATPGFMSFTVPPGFAGQLRLSLGRDAAPGEEWQAPSDATAPGEVLACRKLRGLTAAEATDQLAGSPVTVTWMDAFNGNLEPGAEFGAYASWRVVNVLSLSESRVMVILTETGQWPYPSAPPPQVPPSCKGK